MPGTPIPTELKEQALLRLLPPYSGSLRQIANEVGNRFLFYRFMQKWLWLPVVIMVLFLNLIKKC